MERNNFKRNRFVWFQIWMALCYLPLSCLAQDSIYFQNLTSSEKTTLIIGKDNLLKFDSSIDNILFNSENILKTGKIFRVKPNQSGSISIMLFSGTSMKGSIDFEAKFSKSELLKNRIPQVRLGSLQYGGKVTKIDLVKNTNLNVYFENSTNLNGMEIISFDATYFQKRGDIIDSEHKSSELNEEIIKYVKLAKSGDILFLENIKVKCLDGSIRKIVGVTYQIK
jgi:hypothetical protein